MYTSSLTNFQEISRRYPGYIFLNSRRFFCDKPYSIKMQVKFVMAINEHVMMVSSDQRSSLCHPTHLLIYKQQTQGLPYVQCTKNRLTCENYIANYKIFQEHQLNSRRFPVFLEAISNFRRFPGVSGIVDTLHKKNLCHLASKAVFRKKVEDDNRRAFNVKHIICSN